MRPDDIVDALNARFPPAIRTLRARVLEFAPESGSVTMEFNMGLEFCHSGDVVQGGFVTAMLDAAMSHALSAMGDGLVSASTIDLTVNFLRATRAGRHVGKGYVTKNGRTIGFARGELYSDAGELTATASLSAMIIRKQPG